MKIDNIELEYHIDYLQRKIHLLDLGPRHSQTLLNIISPEFQKKFVKQEALLIDIVDFDWVLYCGSGLVILYSNYTANIVGKSEKWLYTPFKRPTTGI